MWKTFVEVCDFKDSQRILLHTVVCLCMRTYSGVLHAEITQLVIIARLPIFYTNTVGVSCEELQSEDVENILDWKNEAVEIAFLPSWVILT